MASTTAGQGQVFIGPGLSPFKRIVPMIAVLGITALVLWIAVHQGASAEGSTVVAGVFIIGFIVYLRIIAPVPFTITLEPGSLVKRSRNGAGIEIAWEDLTRIREECFPNETRIGIIVHRKTTPQQKA